jgi:hypothetical protein
MTATKKPDTVKKIAMKAKKEKIPYDPSINLMDELANDLHQYLITGDSTSETQLSQFVKTQFSFLNTTSDSYNAVNNIKFLVEISQSAQKQIDLKKQNDRDYIDYYLYKTLMPWQRNVYTSFSHKQSLLCGRRSGKSFVLASKMLRHVIDGPDVVNGVEKHKKSIYIGLTIEKAATVMWGTLKTMCEKAKIPVAKIDNSRYTIELSNGNIIQLAGNNSKAEREKLRGDDFSFCCIDEMQSQQGLGYLINNVIGPIIKGRNGFVMYSGTAPLSSCTYWEYIINDSTFEHIHATMEDNITIPNYATAMTDVLKENKWQADNITYRREYLGEIAYDTNLMVYPKRTYYTVLPKDKKLVHVQVGIDYGFVDHTSLAPVFIYDDGSMYLSHEFKQSGMSATAIIDKIKEMNAFIKNTYHLSDDDIWFVQDNNEQNIGRDVFNAGIKNLYNAYKQGETYQIALVKDALESGQLSITKGDYFDSECSRATWKVDKEKGTVIYELDDANFHMDIGDSVKYAVASYISNQLSQ